MVFGMVEKTDELSFEAALAELEAIVRELESGQGDLDAAIAQYERGTALRTHCSKKLDAARMKVEKIMAAADGGVKTEAFEEA
jgi:exodeoxyribonuclease VII small subunit